MHKIVVVIIATVFLAAGCINEPPIPIAKTPSQPAITPPVIDPAPNPPPPTPSTINFSKFNTAYKFSADIAAEWQVEYVPEIQSINIYNRTLPGTVREQSQIFIRFFEATKFLTLSTVTVLERKESIIHGRNAVYYTIEKKSAVPNFAHQPSWRSSKHKLVDIRYSTSNPTQFYVFAYNPNLPEEQFNNFIDSLKFH